MVDLEKFCREMRIGNTPTLLCEAKEALTSFTFGNIEMLFANPSE